MAKHCAANERIKREYLVFLKEAKRQSEPSLDAAAGAIARFEHHTGRRDFKTFCQSQAVAFKRRLAEQDSAATGGKLSKATLHATLSHLKRFFQWLAGQPGYKSHFSYTDAEYFNVSEKDARIATARREKPVATLEQMRHVIDRMPAASDTERRNRALVAFTLLTGARDSAVASAKMKHVDLERKRFYQDAREVRTKFSKTFTTDFFPVGKEVEEIVVDWISYLRTTKLWGHDDPLFPKTLATVSRGQKFEHVELSREHWATAAPIRQIFREACGAAGLPYFNPHSIRNTLVAVGQSRCQTPEQFKAWSQNLGHEGVMTTLVSYGMVSAGRQSELVRALDGSSNDRLCAGDRETLMRLMQKLRT